MNNHRHQARPIGGITDWGAQGSSLDCALPRQSIKFPQVGIYWYSQIAPYSLQN